MEERMMTRIIEEDEDGNLIVRAARRMNWTSDLERGGKDA